MSTIFDWLALMVFAGLVVIYLQRSVGPRPEHDKVILYLPPAIGCALANYIGNNGELLWNGVLALGMLAFVIVYILRVIRPEFK